MRFIREKLTAGIYSVALKSTDVRGNKGVCTQKGMSWRRYLCAMTIMVFVCVCSANVVFVYADEPLPSVTELPEEKSDESTTVLKDGVSDDYFGKVADGLSTTMEGLVENEEETVSGIVGIGKRVLETVIYYIPFVGIGIFLFGIGIAIVSIVNKSNRRWGLRMAIVTSLVLYLAYIFLIMLYDINFMGRVPKEVIRPDNLDHYGEVYFDVWEEVLDAERLAGLADKALSKDVIAILTKFYQESAFDIGVVVFSLGLLLGIIMKSNPVIKKWARIVLCVIVPVVLYAGYWYISRLS